MTSLLSSVSGNFGKIFLLTGIVPATLLVVCLRLFVAPILPERVLDLGALDVPAPSALGEPVILIALTLAIVVIAALLYTLEVSILNAFEGRPWQRTLLGRYWSERFAASQIVLMARVETLYRLRMLEDTKVRDTAAQVMTRLTGTLRHCYPSNPGLVLPTQFGNVVRSFEDYPRQEYGMDGEGLWPRLYAMVEDDYLEEISNARASTAFLLNLSVVSAILAMTLLVAGALSVPERPLTAVWAPLAASLALAWVFYRLSIKRAHSWGAVMRGAFDLYRHELLKALGHDVKQEGRAYEKWLWEQISRQALHGDHPALRGRIQPLAPPASPPCTASSDRASPDSSLRITRGVRHVDDRSYAVVIDVRNDGEEGCEVTSLTDTLPAGTAYSAGSARLISRPGAPVTVSGLGPYTFQMSAKLSRGDRLSLEYRASFLPTSPETHARP